MGNMTTNLKGLLVGRICVEVNWSVDRSQSMADSAYTNAVTFGGPKVGLCSDLTAIYLDA